MSDKVHNIKHKLLKLKIKLECKNKYKILNNNLKKAIEKTDSETAKYWKIVQKKYAYEKYNLKYETQYDYWMMKNDITPAEIKKQLEYKFEYNPKISILTPLYKTNTDFFRELLYFMEQQTYSNWELCLADGSPEPLEEIQSMIKGDERIKYKYLNKNNGIADNTNEALKLATGDFIALMDHDDTLSIDCLFENVKAINENKDVQFLFSDEDKIYSVGDQRFGAHFKPDFAIDTLRSENYICHFTVLRKDVVEKLEGERSDYDGAQDFELVLRASEIVDHKNIIHIPKILYHWRLSETSTAANAEVKPYAYIAGAKAVQDHLNRLNIDATVTRSEHFGLYNTVYKVKDNPKVNILIINKDDTEKIDKCIKSLLEKTSYNNFEIDVIDNNSEEKIVEDYYNKLIENERIRVLYYNDDFENVSKIINYGVENTDSEYILLLDKNIEVKDPKWLEIMIGTCQRDDVGVVGAKILYPDDTVEHAGLILGMTPLIGNIHNGINEFDPGFFARAIVRQDLSAVSGKCLMTKRKILNEVESFNEKFPNILYDADYCLKVKKNGYMIVYDPLVKIYIHEEKMEKIDLNLVVEQNKTEYELFQKVWKEELENGDPYYNKNLDLNNIHCLIRTDKVE